jgi:hypothetical protein
MYLQQFRTAMVPGAEYMFLGQRAGHFRRGNYATRIVRPAADGRYPARAGRSARATAPVLIDASGPFPGTIVPLWPPAVPGQPFEPRAGRGIPRLAGKNGSGRCPSCQHTTLLRQDGNLISHKVRGQHCTGSGEKAADPVPLASWLPLRPGLTPHGLRHGHQTWLDDLGIRYVLQSERMGHEVPGMRSVYSHVTPRMRAELRDGLQALWEASLYERAALSKESACDLLNALLARPASGALG